MESLLDQSFSTATPFTIIAVRLVAACVMGFVIGLEREVRNRPAGLRTHMLVSLAAALFMVITLEMIAAIAENTDETQLDPLRVIEAITAGVAFLAAGTIITHRGSVKGLTTGASLWLAGAIGVACGAGFLTVALLGTALAFLVLTPLRLLESRFSKDRIGEDGKDEGAE